MQTLLGTRAKYLDFAHKHQWLQHIQPPNDSFFSRMKFSGPGARGGGGAIPVVVQSMPKQAPTPVNINLGGIVVNAGSMQNVPRAAGSYVQDKLRSALGDTHH